MMKKERKTKTNYYQHKFVNFYHFFFVQYLWVRINFVKKQQQFVLQNNANADLKLSRNMNINTHKVSLA